MVAGLIKLCLPFQWINSHVLPHSDQKRYAQKKQGVDPQNSMSEICPRPMTGYKSAAKSQQHPCSERSNDKLNYFRIKLHKVSYPSPIPQHGLQEKGICPFMKKRKESHRSQKQG